jgi:hypothetical protein
MVSKHRHRYYGHTMDKYIWLSEIADVVSGIAVILAANGSVVAETVRVFIEIEVVITIINTLITDSDAS